MCAPIKALLLALAVLASPAYALQNLEGDDGATLIGKVSEKEPTRIAVDQGRVLSLRVREGTLNIDADDETGQVFVTVPAGTKNPINGFLTTNSGRTYTLVLMPTDIPADSIIIKQSKLKSKTALTGQNDFKNNAYEKAVKRLMVVMANDEVPDDMEVRELAQKIALWKEASMTLERQYTVDNIVGESYVVTNTSNAAMVLDEREFYRKGVSAVAIDQHNITPGSGTRVYVIREKSGNE